MTSHERHIKPSSKNNERESIMPFPRKPSPQPWPQKSVHKAKKDTLDINMKSAFEIICQLCHNSNSSEESEKLCQQLIKQFSKLSTNEKKDFFSDLLIANDSGRFHIPLERSYQEILCSLLMSLGSEEKSIIPKFLGDMYDIIHNDKDISDYTDLAFNNFLGCYSSKTPNTTIYFTLRNGSTIFCYLLTPKDLKLNLVEGETLYCQLKNNIFTYFKIDPFPCPICNKHLFDPTDNTIHTCIFPAFKCQKCNQQFVPLEPCQTHCGCEKRYSPKTEIGKQIGILKKQQSYLLHIESLKSFREEICESIAKSIQSPKIHHLFYDFEHQLKTVHSAIALGNEITYMTDYEIVCKLKQKIVDINRILVELYEQTFFCYFCQQEEFLSEPQKNFIRCSRCLNIACHLHRRSESFHCLECHERVSFQSVEFLDVALHRMREKQKVENDRKKQHNQKPKRKIFKPKVSKSKSWRPMKKN